MPEPDRIMTAEFPWGVQIHLYSERDVGELLAVANRMLKKVNAQAWRGRPPGGWACVKASVFMRPKKPAVRCLDAHFVPIEAAPPQILFSGAIDFAELETPRTGPLSPAGVCSEPLSLDLLSSPYPKARREIVFG